MNPQLLSFYSADGRKVEDLWKNVEVMGNKRQLIVFDSKNCRSGVYLLELKTSKGVFFDKSKLQNPFS